MADIRVREAHIYVCGDVGMAAGVYNAIRDAFEAGGFTAAQAQNLMNHLRVCQNNIHPRKVPYIARVIWSD